MRTEVPILWVAKTMRLIYHCLHVYAFVALCFELVAGWIFNADNGDVIMQGPIAIEPSYGQDASVQLRRNSSSFWTFGSGQDPSNDNAFYVKNMNMSSIMSISQQGKFLLTPRPSILRLPKRL